MTTTKCKWSKWNRPIRTITMPKHKAIRERERRNWKRRVNWTKNMSKRITKMGMNK
jgi:hypothetical protein